MRKRLSWLLAVALLLATLMPAGAMAEERGSANSFANTQKSAAEKAALLTESYGTTSVQYALIDHGEIVLSGYAGRNDMEGNKPLSAETMYGIGSTSKMFTAAAVMKLADEGKVDLDEPLVKYIPEFKMKDDRYKQITPRMLLNHSSGLGGSTLTNAFLFEDNDTYAHDTLLEQLAGQQLKADPGAYSVYCNDGFTLAEIMVERITGIDFTSYIHQHFTKPLGMSHTKTPVDKLDSAKMAGLYYPVYQGQLPNETVNVIGTGGIYSTAEDIVRFSQIFTDKDNDILSAESIKAMEQEEYKKGIWPDDADTSFGFGLGWDSVNLFPFGDYGIKALAKGGDTILYHASLVVLPEHQMAAAVLSSGGSSSTDQLLANEILLDALKEKGAIQERKPEKSFGEPVQADMPEDLLKYAGIYGSTNQQIKVELNKDGEMSVSSIQMPDYPAEQYVYTADGSFANADGTAKVSFVTKENGRTYLWVRSYASLPGLGQTAISQFSAEKLPAHEVSEETAKAWKERDGKQYYLLNEKYTSIAYMIAPAFKIELFEEAPGYFTDKKITGPNSAASDLQIPLVGSRDTSEYQFYTKDGVEYVEASGGLYVREEAVKPLYAGAKSSATIPASGHAKWYSVPEAAAGKTMTVELPAKGSFAVYDEKGACVNNTVISGVNEIVLPQNGTVVFAGDAGSKYEITLH